MVENRYYATGKRKTSVARVWMTPGEGRITVNERDLKSYFCRESLINIVQQPLEETKSTSRYDIKATVKGGGVSSQAGAIRHAIAKILAELHPDFRPALKKLGFIKRDPRMKERKKYGQPGARKRFQFSKR